MFHDITFRLILAALAALLYVNHHVLHRNPSRKKKPLRGLERWIFATAMFWTLSIIVYVLGLRALDLSGVLPVWARWLGVAAMASCIPLSHWTYTTLGKHFSKHIELIASHELVQSGPYRYVRHPMYATLFLCAVATCLISANGLMIVSALTVVPTMLLRMRREDAMLHARFGDSYREYWHRTGALWPKFATMAP